MMDVNTDGCLACCEGIEALEEKLLRADYTRLENLALCNACRGTLLCALEDRAIEESEEEVHAS